MNPLNDFITPDEMSEIENNCENIGLSRLLLMENAASSVVNHLKLKFEALSLLKTVIVSGKGNNGGDGFALARHLSGYHSDVTVILIGNSSDIKTPESQINYNILQRIKNITRIEIIDPSDLDLVKLHLEHADLIIDAIFGTGLTRPIRNLSAAILDLINSSSAYTLSLDIPSGLNSVTGKINGKSVNADETITFHKMKKGLINNSKLSGEVHLMRIGIPIEAESLF